MGKIFDLDEFGLFLAANLLGGTAQMEATLEEACSRPTFQLYWRSPLLAKLDSLEPLAKFLSTNTKNDKNNKKHEFDLIFVDATFCFQPKPKTGNDDESHKEKTPNNCVSVMFGVFFQLQETNDLYYFQSPMLTNEMLDDHVDQHNVILEETASHVIARQMAQAFQDLPTPEESIRVKTASSDSSIIDIISVGIPLSYKDGDDNGTSQFTICQTGSQKAEKLGSSGQAWISSILAEQRYKRNIIVQKGGDDEKDPDFVDVKKATCLLEKFKEWKDAALERWDSEEKARNPKENEAGQCDNGEDSTTAATINSNVAPKPSPSTKPFKDTNKDKEQDKKKKSKSKTGAIRRTAPMMRVGVPSKKKAKLGARNPFGPAKK